MCPGFEMEGNGARISSETKTFRLFKPNAALQCRRILEMPTKNLVEEFYSPFRCQIVEQDDKSCHRVENLQRPTKIAR